MKKIASILKTFLSSRKNQAMIAGAIVWLVALLGLDLPIERVTQIIGLFAAYILGVGLSDIGKEAEKIRADVVREVASANAGKSQAPRNGPFETMG